MSRPEKFWPKRTNLQTHCRRNFPGLKFGKVDKGPVYMEVGEETRLTVVAKYNAFTYNLTNLGCWVEVSWGCCCACPKLTSRERRKLNSRKRMYLFMKASRVVLRGVRLREEPLTWYVMRNSLKYGQFTALNIPKCEHFTHLVCLLRFLVISAIRQLGNVQSFKTYVFCFWAFCYESDPG